MCPDGLLASCNWPDSQAVVGSKAEFLSHISHKIQKKVLSQNGGVKKKKN